MKVSETSEASNGGKWLDNKVFQCRVKSVGSDFAKTGNARIS